MTKKLRPNLNKSPFIVLSVGKTTLLVKRLVGSLTMQGAVDMVREYKKDSPYFQDLPPEILNIVGKPLTVKSLKELAEKDQLEPLFLDKVLSSKPTPPSTTKQALQREVSLQEALLEDKDLVPVADDQPLLTDTAEKTRQFQTARRWHSICHHLRTTLKQPHLP